MSENQGGERAFPGPRVTELEGQFYGMFLRDYFAAQALSGMLANNYREGFPQAKAEDYVTSAYIFADAMLAGREKSK